MSPPAREVQPSGDDSWDWGSKVEVEEMAVVHESVQQTSAAPPSGATSSGGEAREVQELKEQYQALQQEHDKVSSLRHRAGVHNVHCFTNHPSYRVLPGQEPPTFRTSKTGGGLNEAHPDNTPAVVA